MSRRVVPARPALVWLMLLLALASMTPRGAIAASERRVARTMLRSGMVRIPAGAYRPPFTAPAASSIRVAAFHLDRTVVTRAAFDRFVRAHPDWNRASVDSSLVEPGYLREWASAGHVSRTDDAGRPVTRVSWHAASAYCAAQGKRLPTTAEWEYAATASESARDGSGA